MRVIIIIFSILALELLSCNKLDLNPLSQASSGNFYTTEDQFELAVNDLYREFIWTVDQDDWTDDWITRNTLTEITGGTINGDWSLGKSIWSNAYKAIARCNIIIANADEKEGAIDEEKLNLFRAEARFVRAVQYAKLISHWGDVPFYTGTLDIEEAFALERTDKNTILQSIYEDYDYAASILPLTYSSSELKRATKGAALAMKARIALYMQDWPTAKDAALSCIDLSIYTLYPSFQELFLSSTNNPNEVIFSVPRSVALGDAYDDNLLRNVMTRNAGGFGGKSPSWELFCSYLCTDGLPIDKSPLYNPQEPFNNRDPRCTATIVKFQTKHLGFMYQPHPDSLTVYNFSTGKYQRNEDTRPNQTFASYNGLIWNKWVDDDWLDYKTDVDIFIIRYADVLLMYAEAMTELGQIDASVLKAINQVRARAYGVDYQNTSLYPTVTTTDQLQLRKIVRVERRMEFAFEGIRYMDIIRWKIAGKVLNRNNYGMLDPAELKEKIVNKGLWFFPQTPPIDEDGIADFSSMYNAGLIKLIAQRNFDTTRQYLWPIPSTEIKINSNIKQNPGY